MKGALRAGDRQMKEIWMHSRIFSFDAAFTSSWWSSCRPAPRRLRVMMSGPTPHRLSTRGQVGIDCHGAENRRDCPDVDNHWTAFKSWASQSRVGETGRKQAAR